MLSNSDSKCRTLTLKIHQLISDRLNEN